jgi:hypothetical protein
LGYRVIGMADRDLEHGIKGLASYRGGKSCSISPSGQPIEQAGLLQQDLM